MNSLLRRRLPAVSAAAFAGLTLSLLTGSVAFAVPLTPHQMPFPCGETWTGSTRGSHTPSIRAIDWNRTADEGDPVVASAAGTVTTADSTSTRSYGHHVVIDHGNGESSVYGHMDQVTVVTGQYVDQGSMIGTVGNTGNSHGAHLHFEERQGSSVIASSFGGVPYFYGALTSFNCVDVPIAADFTGDNISEVAVFRRGKKSSFVVNDPAGARVLMFGNATDEPVVGDWDGDGADDLGVYRASEGTFYLRQVDGTSAGVLLGDADDIPVAGDWDGNGVTDVGVYDQATSTFTVRVVDGNGQVWTAPYQLGAAGDLPVVGDWDGDGVSDLGVWAPTTATFTQGRAAFPAGRTLASMVPEGVTSRLTVKTVKFGLPRG